MKESIGEIIRESVRRSGLTQEEFAKEMGMTLRNLANLFNRERLPVEQIVRASKILKEDFIKRYFEILYDEEPGLSNFPRESKQDYVPIKAQESHLVSLTFKVNGVFEKLTAEMPDLLKTFKKEAESRGLHLG